jgi:hypothetical protein
MASSSGDEAVVDDLAHQSMDTVKMFASDADQAGYQL